MSSLSLTYTLVPGTPENVSHVQQNFVDVRTWANGNIDSTNITDGGIATADLADLAITTGKINDLAVTAAKVAANTLTDAQFISTAGMYTAYRTLLNAASAVNGGTAASTRFLNSGVSATSGNLGGGTPGSLPIIYFDDADFTIGGRTPVMRIRAQTLTNATAPAATFTVGLYPFTVNGGAGQLNPTIGTVVTGSTAAIATPGASAITSAVGADFTIPADGAYALGVVTSGGATAANSEVQVSAQLQIHWT